MNEELSELIRDMDIPDVRRDLSSRRNLEWLGRNMFVRNKEHPNFESANNLLRTILRSGGR